MVERSGIKKLKLLNKKRRMIEEKYGVSVEKYHLKVNEVDKKYGEIYDKLSVEEKNSIQKIIPEEVKVFKIIDKELELLDMISQEHILELAKKQGITKKKTIQSLDNLEYRGLLYRPRHGYYKTTSKRGV